MRRLSEQLTEAYYLSADERVVRRLAELAELYDGSVLPQEALAELAGTSRATVNRVLRDLERGSVALGRARIEVEEVDRLARSPSEGLPRSDRADKLQTRGNRYAEGRTL